MKVLHGNKFTVKYNLFLFKMNHVNSEKMNHVNSVTM